MRNDLIFRQAKDEDFSAILDCLSALTDVSGDLEKIQSRYNFVRRMDHSVTYVVELKGQENSSDCYGIHPQVVGTVRLNFELKIARNAGIVIHLEDVAVARNFQGKGVGLFLIGKVLEQCNEFKHYTIKLCCIPQLEEFYGQWGFKKSGIEMRLDNEEK
jgi:glucosamine-phosphate N-acetyltransferase